MGEGNVLKTVWATHVWGCVCALVCVCRLSVASVSLSLKFMQLVA